MPHRRPVPRADHARASGRRRRAGPAGRFAGRRARRRGPSGAGLGRRPRRPRRRRRPRRADHPRAVRRRRPRRPAAGHGDGARRADRRPRRDGHRPRLGQAPGAGRPSGAGVGGRFVGGHPMCGTERSGHAAVDPALFSGARWALCLEPGTELPRWLRVAEVALAVGAEVVPVTAAEHDDAVAAISHVPTCWPPRSPPPPAEAGPLALALAAGSFRDGTRVIGSDPGFVHRDGRGQRRADRRRAGPGAGAAGAPVGGARRRRARRRHPPARDGGRCGSRWTGPPCCPWAAPAARSPGGWPPSWRAGSPTGRDRSPVSGVPAAGRVSAWTRPTSSAGSTRWSTRSTSSARTPSTPTRRAPG